MDQYNPQMHQYVNVSDAPPPTASSQPQQPPMSAISALGQPPKPPHHNGIVADVKPRLTKEQHDILENHFSMQPKPSTNTKKSFAEHLGVPLDKINNWFQNRRAKVKQDMKKQMNQLHLTQYQVSGHNPQFTTMAEPQPQSQQQPPQQPSPQPPPQLQHHHQHLQQQQQQQQQQPQPLPVAPEYYSTVTSAADMNSFQNLDLSTSSHVPMFDMQHPLRSIPESSQSSYHPNAVMHSFMAATQGAPSYIQNQAASLPQQDPSFHFDMTGAHNYSDNLNYSLSHSSSGPLVLAQDGFGALPDFSTFPLGDTDFSDVLRHPALGNANSVDVQNSVESGSSEPSPFSGTQSTATTQSSCIPNANDSAVTSITSKYSGFTHDHNESTFDYNLPQATVSDQVLIWDASGPTQPLSQPELYQHANASAHAIMTSPSQVSRKHSSGTLDLEPPSVFGDDIYTRRNSSTTNLANNIEAIHLQGGHTPDGFKQPDQSSTIAARRQKRPTNLNSSTLRSASYSGMSSPGGDQSLRRIRSSINSSSGRIQKSSSNSAQRSPLASTFADAAASPKFARAFSSSSTANGGSLAPPTPLTPNEGNQFYWPNGLVIPHQSTAHDHSSPDNSVIMNWMHESAQSRTVSTGASPPTHVRSASDSLYKDTPPQSAPATQPSFSRASFIPPSQMRSGFHSSTDLTTAQSLKPMHMRRPSLPGPAHESQSQFTNDMFLDDFSELPCHGLPFAPPASATPDLFINEFSLPTRTDMANRYRYAPPADLQQKNYVFANQGPSDFKT